MKFDSKKTFSRFEQLLQPPLTLDNLNKLLKLFNAALGNKNARLCSIMWQNQQFRQILENNSLITMDQRLAIFETALKNKRKNIIKILINYPIFKNWFTQTPIEPQSIDKRLFFIEFSLENNYQIIIQPLLSNSSFKEILSKVCLNSNSNDSKVTWERIFNLFQAAFLKHQENLTYFLLAINEDFDLWLQGEIIKDPQTNKVYSLNINNIEQMLIAALGFRHLKFSHQIFSSKIFENWLNNTALLKIISIFKKLAYKRSLIEMNKLWCRSERLRHAYCGYPADFGTTNNPNIQSIPDQELIENFFKLTSSHCYTLIKGMFRKNLRLQNLLQSTEAVLAQKIFERIIFYTDKAHPDPEFIQEYLAIIINSEIIKNILNAPKAKTLLTLNYITLLENRFNELTFKSTTPLLPLPLELCQNTNKRKADATSEFQLDINDKKFIIDNLIIFLNDNDYVKKIPTPAQLQTVGFHIIENQMIGIYFDLLQHEIGIKFAKSISQKCYYKIYLKNMEKYKKFWDEYLTPLANDSSITLSEKELATDIENKEENNKTNSFYKLPITFFSRSNLTLREPSLLELTEEEIDDWAARKPFTS